MSATNASEQTIFDAACQMTDAQARAAYLEGACAGKPELRQRMESLLQALLRLHNFQHSKFYLRLDHILW